jgi:hypothetical protein
MTDKPLSREEIEEVKAHIKEHGIMSYHPDTRAKVFSAFDQAARVEELEKKITKAIVLLEDEIAPYTPGDANAELWDLINTLKALNQKEDK